MNPLTRTLGVIASAALLLASCGGRSDGCRFDFSGDVTTQTTSSGACATLSDTGTLDLESAGGAIRLTASFELGVDRTGTFGPTTVQHWQSLGVAGQTNCAYAAGDQASPGGDFTLWLEAGVHGTLHLATSVQAPQGVDCGPGEVESVDVSF